MNKLLTIFLAIVGGIDAVISIVTPILLALMWIQIAGLTGFQSNMFFYLGLFATLFRGIKLGFLKD